MSSRAGVLPAGCTGMHLAPGQLHLQHPRRCRRGNRTSDWSCLLSLGLGFVGFALDSTACLATRHISPEPHREIAWRAEGLWAWRLRSRHCQLHTGAPGFPPFPQFSGNQAGACIQWGMLAGAVLQTAMPCCLQGPS